jgi:hypothetical protein
VEKEMKKPLLEARHCPQSVGHDYFGRRKKGNVGYRNAAASRETSEPNELKFCQHAMNQDVLALGVDS